jgi:hypothetical protein
MHNGVLSDAPSVNSDMSDTWHFVEYIIKPIAKSNLALLWDSKEFQTWLTKKMGFSKLLLMRSDTVEGQAPVLIFNKDAGTEETGCWLSNSYSTKESTPTVFTPNKPYAGGNASTNYPFTVGQRLLPKMNPTTTGATITTTDDKVIPLFNRNPNCYIVPDELLYTTARSLKGLQQYELSLFAKDDPDLCADIIMAFYPKNTMPYEIIIDHIKSPDTLGGITRLLEHVSQTVESIVKTRNSN